MNRVLAALANRKRGADRPTSDDPASLIDSAVQILAAGEAVPIDAVTMTQPVSSSAQGEAFMRAVEDAASEHQLIVEATIGYGRVRVRLSRRAGRRVTLHGER